MQQHFPGHQTEPEAVNVREAARRAGVGRTLLYGAIGTGELVSIKVGKRRLILIEDLRGWLAKQRGVGPLSAQSR